jgi:hypothetical protein
MHKVSKSARVCRESQTQLALTDNLVIVLALSQRACTRSLGLSLVINAFTNFGSTTAMTAISYSQEEVPLLSDFCFDIT